jgi:hypothetical protein
MFKFCSTGTNCVHYNCDALIKLKDKRNLGKTSNDHSYFKICALLGHYAASSGNPLPAFRDNVSVSSSKVKKTRTSWLLKMGRIRCPETSVKDYRSTLRNIPEERRAHQHRGGSLIPRLFVLSFRFFNRRAEATGTSTIHSKIILKYIQRNGFTRV